MLFEETQLNNKNFLKEIEMKSRDFIDYDQFREAYDLAKTLEQSINKVKGFKEKSYELYRSYQEIIIKLKWIGLPIMTEGMAIDYFQNHFTKIFSIPDYDFDNLWRKLGSILLIIMNFTERDKFKKKLTWALLNNQEKITSRELMINNQRRPPTVGNWLLDYNSNLGTGVVDNLKRVQYFSGNNNIKVLPEQEKARVKTLLDLYERLKLSSFTLEGLEEDIPVDEDDMEGTIRGGVFEPYKEEDLKPSIITAKPSAAVEKKFVPPKPPVRSQPALKPRQASQAENDLTELRELANKYPPGSFERKVIEEEINRVTRNS